MDYQTEQQSEIELIQTVYPDELEILNESYPNIRLKVELPCVPKHENPEPDFYVTLTISLPEKYPDESPELTLEGFPDHIPKASVQEITNQLEEQAKSMPGYQVLITLITELQYTVPVLIKQLERKQEEEEEKKRIEAHEQRERAFEGNRVTVESFNKWKVEFERDFFAAELEAKRQKDALLANKLTGKQLFLRDSTLNESDLGIIETAESEPVEIDQSLFEEDLSDLDIDDEESDD